LGSERSGEVLEFEAFLLGDRYIRRGDGFYDIVASNLALEATETSEEAEDWGYAYTYDGIIVSDSP
jgi:hypothetical protein